MNANDFEAWFKSNAEKINALAEANTKRNANGDTTISRDDPWFYEDEWDEYYKELIAKDTELKAAVMSTGTRRNDSVFV